MFSLLDTKRKGKKSASHIDYKTLPKYFTKIFDDMKYL